jgi:L-threonylcarbamoyladenylate synthase
MERVTYEDLGPLVAALHAGATVAIPTDTVYGLACAAHDRTACETLLRAKGRSLAQPSAIVAGTVGGPLTLVLPNPGRRYRWLCGEEPDRIGLRVPDLDPRLAAAIDRVPALLLTSANATGEPPAVAFADLAAVPPIAAVALDGGTCPGGVPSTVVDVAGDEPAIVREGPVALDEIRARL